MSYKILATILVLSMNMPKTAIPVLTDCFNEMKKGVPQETRLDNEALKCIDDIQKSHPPVPK